MPELRHRHLPKYNIGAYFLTARTHNNIRHLRVPACAKIFCEELKAARIRYCFHVLAFVVMPDHVHLLLWWDNDRPPELTLSKVAWAVKGLSARRIVAHLKQADKGVANEVDAGKVNGVGEGKANGAGEGPTLAYPSLDDNALTYPRPEPNGVGEGNALVYPHLLRPTRGTQDKPHRRNWRYQVWQPGTGYDFNVYTERKLLEKIAYIHANPVRAGLADDPEDYPWSSAHIYAGRPALHPVTITLCTEVLW